MKNNEIIIASNSPDKYKKFDTRSLKPVYLTEVNEKVGAVIEQLDYIKADNLKQKIEYIPPNNIAMQLQIVDKCIDEMKNMNISERLHENRKMMIMKERVYENSKIIYDYIGLVQQGIVFGYTALETFSNISIPESYEYSVVNNKNIIEIYNKESIERWITLKEKLSKVLPEIYGTEDIKKRNLWNDFLRFEEFRHEIIHQKSIEHTSFYRKYFKNNIYKYLEVPRNLIDFYYSETTRVGKTNPLWPWMGNNKEIIPTKGGAKEFFSQSEIVGNLYEGKK